MDRPAPACDASIGQAFGLLGKRWNGVIVGSLAAGPLGFAELSRAVGGISDSMLSDRLAELAAAGVVRRGTDPGPPVGARYALTPAGRSLAPLLRELGQWAARHLPAPGAAAGGCGAGAPDDPAAPLEARAAT